MSKFTFSEHLNEMGYVVINSVKLIQQVQEIKSLFHKEFESRMSQASPENNRELIKRFVDHPFVSGLFCSNNFIKILNEEIGFNIPVKCGPTVSHYTSLDETGNGYGLPYHQDYPSMSSSKLSVICWLNLVDSSAESHGIELIPKLHKDGLLSGSQTDRGYILSDEVFDRRQSIVPQIKAGELLVMTSFTPHRTFVNSNFIGWKLSISQRFDDLSDSDWASRGYKNAYDIIVNREMYKT